MSQPKRQGSHFNNKTWTSCCLSFECPCGVDDYNKDHNVFQNQEHGNDYEDRIVGENLKNVTLLVKLLLEGGARGDTEQLFDSGTWKFSLELIGKAIHNYHQFALKLSKIPPKIRKEFHFCTFLRWRGLDEPQPMVCLPVTEAAREQDDLSMWCNSAQQGPNCDSVNVMLTMIITDMMIYI